MGKIYDVVADWEGEPPVPGAKIPSPRSFGARRTREEAETLLVEQLERPGGWSNYRVQEVDTTGMFEIPPRQTPRERYTINVEVTRSIEAGEHDYPRAVHVQVLDRERVVAEYDRNYAMLRTFEPFRQGDRDFALISTNYTATSVMDLQTGEIIAGEEPNAGGFCPVGFYVPDWWDIHAWEADCGTLPGSLGWTADHEWPTGDFGFVWGCIWGDDNSWKVQYLDLSRVQSGEVKRDERFGYTILDTGESEGNETWRPAREFISLWADEGQRRAEFRTWKTHDLATGTMLKHSWD